MSLQWKTTLFLLFLLLGVGTGFIIHEQRVLKSQYRTLRHNEVTRQVSLSEEAIRQVFLQLQMVAGTLATREDVRQALSLGSSAPLGQKFENDWSILQINAGLVMLRLLDRHEKLIQEDRDGFSSGVPAVDEPEMLQRHRTTTHSERPQIFASCPDTCLLYAWAPVQYRGTPVGTVMVAAPMTEVILLFNRVTPSDIGIVRNSGTAESENYAAVSDGDMIGMTGGEKSQQILRRLDSQWVPQWGNSNVQWQETRLSDIRYEVTRWPIAIESIRLPADFVLITNVEPVYAGIRDVLRRSILNTVGGILGAAFAAVILSRLFIRRLNQTTAAILLLGQKDYAGVRNKLEQATHRRHLNDELDRVTQTTLHVAGNLEQMEIEARNYQARLSHMLLELEHERAFIANLLDTAPVLVVVHDARGRVTLCNQFACTLMGIPRANSNPAVEIFFPAEQAMAARQTLRPGHIIRHESILQDAASEAHHIAWMHCRLTQETEAPLILSVGQDITLLKRSQAEQERLQGHLVQAQKMEAIGQLTGGIAHDFNNLLGSMMGYTALALERCVPDKESKLAGYLGEVMSSGERARDIIAQMLAFSRPGETDTYPMQLGSLVKEVVRFLRPMLPSTMTIAVEIDETPPVRANPVQIQQLLMNLMINARDAMPADGNMTICLRLTALTESACASCHTPVKGEFVELSVNDNGSGITQEHLDRIFDPFYTTKEVGKGSGMGLSVVHGLAHRFGGHIVLDTVLGTGSSFRLLFPSSLGH